MEQQRLVRRRYISKPRPRPLELVPACQPLAALAPSSVALDRHHVALAPSSVALDCHHVALAPSSVALDRHHAALAPSSTALGAKASQPLAAEPHQPKRKRTQTGTRVQLFGQRLSCSVSMRGPWRLLKSRLLNARLATGSCSRKT